jgi:malate synthase
VPELIETIVAAFEMDEIPHELRKCPAELGAGRGDCSFSCTEPLRRNRG